MTDTNEQLAIFRESIKRRDVHLARVDERRHLSWGPYGPVAPAAAAEAAAQDALLAAQSLDEALTAGARPPDAWKASQMLTEPHSAPFKCPAVYHHGPGSMSRTRCERKVPHGLDDEHYARNPMCPGFEWTGQDGWDR